MAKLNWVHFYNKSLMNGLGKHGGVGRLRALERKSKAGRGEWRKNKSMHSNTCYILRHNYKIKIRNLYTFLWFYYTYFENMGLIFPNIVLYLSIREYTVITYCLCTLFYSAPIDKLARKWEFYHGLKILIMPNIFLFKSMKSFSKHKNITSDNRSLSWIKKTLQYYRLSL